MADINPGDLVRVRTEPPFQNEALVATDPTTVKLVWKRRGSPPTTWVHGVDGEIVRDSAGTFHADILVEKAGKHFYRWIGEGNIQAVEEGEFTAVEKFA